MAKPGPKSKAKEVVEVKPDRTKDWLLALGSLALALFFALASFDSAGAAGRFIYPPLRQLFGTGFYIIPLVLACLAGAFFKNTRPDFVWRRLLAGLVCFISLLGLGSLLLGHWFDGGLVGQALAGPLTKLFDRFSTVFLATLTIISLIIMFERVPDFGFVRRFFSWLKNRRVGDLVNSDTDEAVSVSAAGAALPLTTPLVPPPAAETPLPPPLKIKNGEDEDELFNLKQNRTPRLTGAFKAPPLDLLESDSGKPGAGDLKNNANVIKRTLANFGIVVEMDEISIGPSITRYALKPAEGVKLSRILGLQNDLALALAAHPIRIEAPIPGKSLVGIEIPNSVKSTVGLGSLLARPEYQDSPLPLMMALGRDITGRPHFANLAKAPHLLVAGTTGSGKSVVIHAFITSLLYRNPPSVTRFIMIDPKRVELTAYNKIPHLLTPVVTEPKKAILALKWAIKEMERRYALLEKSGNRDISSYQASLGADPEAESMPYIVIIIDELADIMSTYPRELEAAIVRLAQMSRAVGIHLILSTQRPSVEVITGLIKANIPSRLALQVASQIDSRTIIDMAGAEKLLGAGDLLYQAGDMGKPVRLQSAFITESEIKKVARYLSENSEPSLGDDIITVTDNQNPDAALWESDGPGEDDDELYEEARQLVIEAGKASASYLQRKLKVGYARAARLLDMLEERKVIGPASGSKIRSVYDPSVETENF
jgi:S-DNA-T family DNA segregation ATPase FtsK/SpoIIIE